MAYVASALREKHSEDKLHILVAETNSGNFTYDGIDLGGERVTKEIETYAADLEKGGCHIKKISIVGYSLGGLVARYAIGLLYSKGWFEKVKPINFTTFASPHLGVRTPLLGVGYRVSVLADPSSIFILALAQFKHRVLYANIVNDRSAPYYTTCISTKDEFTNSDAINIKYLPEYAPIVLDPTDPVSLKPPEVQPPFITRLVGSSSILMSRVPLFALLCVMIPIGSVVFLINAGIQNVRSQQRIKLHEDGKSGIGLGSYRIPLMVENARHTMERAYENISAGQQPEYLPIEDSDDASDSQEQLNGHAEKTRRRFSGASLRHTSSRHDEFPTLALTPDQFAMVDALDDVGFRKYRVHINVRHSHAAIIVRSQRSSLKDGKVVIRHWLESQFEI
ncbi:hypothetical protein P7C71_g13, partial [Lecanoromycetidae sp. Uapishka_2]